MVLVRIFEREPSGREKICVFFFGAAEGKRRRRILLCFSIDKDMTARSAFLFLKKSLVDLQGRCAGFGLSCIKH